MLSVVIPADLKDPCPILKKTLNSLNQMTNLEIICVSNTEGHSRAERLNIGFKRSQGNLLLFHHPRSFVDPQGIQYLIDLSMDPKMNLTWGGLTHQFDISHPLLKFTSWYSNNVRGAKNGILYLDHCIFFDRRLWKNDLPTVDIFEDTILSYEFRKISKPLILPYTSTTSAIRFTRNGVWKQALLNQSLKIAFHLKMSHSMMNKIYEKGLNLNSIYSKGRK